MSVFTPIYNIFLKPHEQWRFYITDDGSLLSISNTEKPFIPLPNAIWDSSIKDFKYGQYISPRDTISVPTMGVRKEDLDEFLLPQLKATAEANLDVYGNDRFAIFVGQKELSRDLIEVGIFAPGQRGIDSSYEHNRWEEEVNRHINRPSGLKAFW